MPPRPRSAPRPAPRRAGPREPAPPKPPPSLELAVLPEHDLAAEAEFARLGFYDIDLAGRTADAVEFTQCRFRQANLSGCVLDGVTVTDCLVEHSDWANLRSSGGALVRTRVAASRMTGLCWVNALARDVTFDDCRLDLSAWRFTDLKTVRFTNCNLAKADFTGTDLTGAQFVGCDLTGAQFDKSTMDGASFRDCVLVGIGGILSWRGAIVHGVDLVGLSYTLAHAIGIQIVGGDD